MNPFQEIARIERVEATAWTYVMEGNFRKARREVKKIRQSMCVTESEQAVALVEAKILERCGDNAAARERILSSICYLWGRPEAFEILSNSNPAVDVASRLFHLEILGSCTQFGFTADHITTVDVIANSQEEAVAYVQEVCGCGESSSRSIIHCSDISLEDAAPSEMPRHRGILLTYPFRLSPEERGGRHVMH